MFPIAIVGGIIGAVVSVAKAADWLSDKLESANGAGSAGGKPEPTKLTEAQASAFAATLAAQTAGQALPPSLPVSPAPDTIPQLRGTDYAMLDRMKAGLVAYNHVGEHRGNHAGAIAQAKDDRSGG